MTDLPAAVSAGFVKATAKRILGEHRSAAMAFAQGRLDAAVEAGETPEIEIWQAIVAAIGKLARRQRY